jgi:hypothetical protein
MIFRIDIDLVLPGARKHTSKKPGPAPATGAILGGYPQPDADESFLTTARIEIERASIAKSKAKSVACPTGQR